MVKPKVDQPENPLFTNGDNHQMNACVGDNGGPYNLFDYGRGFFEGGHAAVKSAQEYIGPVDLLVYPAAFANIAVIYRVQNCSLITAGHSYG